MNRNSIRILVDLNLELHLFKILKKQISLINEGILLVHLINKYEKIHYSILRNAALDKEKKDFILLEILNLILTNTLLQILLLLLSEIKISTLISQLFNIMFGYLIYSKKVFNESKYSFRKFLNYYITCFFVLEF